MSIGTKLDPCARQQRGAILVVSLLLLLVMTILALGASQATRMEERMAGNLRDHDLALQASEAGLRAGERLIHGLTTAPSTCAAPPCQVYKLGSLAGDFNYENLDWWGLNAKDYAASSLISGTAAGNVLAKRDPKYFIEEVEEVTDTLTIPPSGPPPSRIYYRITSNGWGGTLEAQVVLQTTFARRF